MTDRDDVAEVEERAADDQRNRWALNIADQMRDRYERDDPRVETPVEVAAAGHIERLVEANQRLRERNERLEEERDEARKEADLLRHNLELSKDTIISAGDSRRWLRDKYLDLRDRHRTLVEAVEAFFRRAEGPFVCQDCHAQFTILPPQDCGFCINCGGPVSKTENDTYCHPELNSYIDAVREALPDGSGGGERESVHLTEYKCDSCGGRFWFSTEGLDPVKGRTPCLLKACEGTLHWRYGAGDGDADPNLYPQIDDHPLSDEEIRERMSGKPYGAVPNPDAIKCICEAEGPGTGVIRDPDPDCPVHGSGGEGEMHVEAEDDAPERAHWCDGELQPGPSVICSRHPGTRTRRGNYVRMDQIDAPEDPHEEGDGGEMTDVQKARCIAYREGFGDGYGYARKVERATPDEPPEDAHGDEPGGGSDKGSVPPLYRRMAASAIRRAVDEGWYDEGFGSEAFASMVAEKFDPSHDDSTGVRGLSELSVTAAEVLEFYHGDRDGLSDETLETLRRFRSADRPAPDEDEEPYWRCWCGEKVRQWACPECGIAIDDVPMANPWTMPEDAPDEDEGDGDAT